MRRRTALVVGVALILGWSTSAAAAQGTRTILALGSVEFLRPAAVQAAGGAEVVPELGGSALKEFALVVLANVAFTALPAPIQQGVVDYVTEGGAVLITGGAQSFGAGGYQAVASILPFQLRSSSDWRATPFREPVPVQPGHPILAGVAFIPIGTLNDMNPRPGATEILRSAGGGTYPYPLIAEMAPGAGRVLGIAFDPNALDAMRDRDLFVQQVVAYLLGASRMGQGR